MSYHCDFSVLFLFLFFYFLFFIFYLFIYLFIYFCCCCFCFFLFLFFKFVILTSYRFVNLLNGSLFIRSEMNKKQKWKRKEETLESCIPGIKIKVTGNDQRCNHTNNCSNWFCDQRTRPWNAQGRGGWLAVG